MKPLYYGTINNGDGKRLQQVIESLISIEKTEVYRNIAELDKRLRHPTSDIAISVLFTKNKAEFFDLILIKKLLINLRIILVLPDADNETITMGHSLFPRFMTYADSDFKDIEAILKKLMENEHKYS